MVTTGNTILLLKDLYGIKILLVSKCFYLDVPQLMLSKSDRLTYYACNNVSKRNLIEAFTSIEV